MDTLRTFTTGSGEFSGNLVPGGPIAWVEFFNSNAGKGTDGQCEQSNRC
jgi:hypothetical protein